MDKEIIRQKAEALKAQDLKVSEHLNDEEFKLLYGFPRPTPERLIAYREKAAVTRAANRAQQEKLRKQLRTDYEQTLDELVPVALMVLRDNMHDPKVEIRQKAALEVLNRRYGRPSQQIQVKKDTSEDEIVYRSSVLDAMKEGETASRN